MPYTDYMARAEYIRVFFPLKVTDPLPESGYLTVEDVSLYLGIGKETIRRYLVDGLIKGHHEQGAPGKKNWRWAIPVDQVRAFAEIGPKPKHPLGRNI